MGCARLEGYLREHHVPTATFRHPPTYSSQETAEVMHIPGDEIAKAVLVKLDGAPAIVVLPAPEHVDLEALSLITGAYDVSLADEEDLEGYFPDCEMGAVPPFGNLWGLPVYVSDTLADRTRVAFNPGNHEELVLMRFADFERLVHPRIAHFTVH